MYVTVLMVHSWMRWLAIVAGIGATFAAFRSRGDDRGADLWSVVFMTTLDIQMLLGLLLYLVISPNMQVVREHFGEAMKIPQLRFWAVEHIGAMMVAVVLAHVGRVLVRKTSDPAAKRMRRLVCVGLATVIIIAGTPWPGLVYGRPWLRIGQ